MNQVINHCSNFILFFFCFSMISLGDSHKELGGVRFGPCSHCRRFAAQSPGQHRDTTGPWDQGQSFGANSRKPGLSSWQFAAW